jgi:hypothetical protein
VYISPELISGGNASNPNIYEPPLLVTTASPVLIKAPEAAEADRARAPRSPHFVRPADRMPDTLHTF